MLIVILALLDPHVCMFAGVSQTGPMAAPFHVWLGFIWTIVMNTSCSADQALNEVQFCALHTELASLLLFEYASRMKIPFSGRVLVRSSTYIY